MSRTHPIFLLWALASIAILSPWSAAFANPTYTVTDLGTVPGVSPDGAPGDSPVFPTAINSAGQIVGVWSSQQQVNGPAASGVFLYSNGQMTDITASGANGSGINNVGTLTYVNDSAINNAGDTTGWDTQGPFLNQNGLRTVLPSGFYPSAINDGGVVVGYYGNTNQGALYSGGKLEVFGPPGTDPSAINNAGQVVGGVESGSQGSAFYFDGSSFHQLAGLTATGDSLARGINNLGEIVGSASIDAAGDSHAFLSLSGSPMVDLNTLIPPGSGWVLTSATAINDLGVIVGVGSYNGQLAAFELTPVAQPVPEPATLALACVCVAYVGLQRWARRRPR